MSKRGKIYAWLEGRKPREVRDENEAARVLEDAIVEREVLAKVGLLEEATRNERARWQPLLAAAKEAAALWDGTDAPIGIKLRTAIEQVERGEP